jgi:hypothetical protein
VAPTNFALVDSARPVAIENLEGWHANRIVDAVTKGSLQAAGLTLDELVERENVQPIDFLKMNIEGAEATAIAPCESLARCVSRVMISASTLAKENSSAPGNSRPASGHCLPGECRSRLTPLFRAESAE